MTVNGKSRDELAREANLVRSRLLRTVERLDQRRHDALDIRTQLERHLRQLVMAGGLLLVATAGAVALVVHHISTAAERRRRDRWRLARRVWRHPDRAMRAERRSFFGELARSLLLAIATTAVATPARRAVATLIDRKTEAAPR
jgi:hypothetical protein